MYDGQAVLDASRRRVVVEAGQMVLVRRGEWPEPARSLGRDRLDDFAAWDREQSDPYSNDEGQGRSSRYLPQEVAPYASDFENNGSWHYETEVGYVWAPRVRGRLAALLERPLVLDLLRLDVGAVRALGLRAVALRPLGLLGRSGLVLDSRRRVEPGVGLVGRGWRHGGLVPAGVPRPARGRLRSCRGPGRVVRRRSPRSRVDLRPARRHGQPRPHAAAARHDRGRGGYACALPTPRGAGPPATSAASKRHAPRRARRSSGRARGRPLPRSVPTATRRLRQPGSATAWWSGTSAVLCSGAGASARPKSVPAKTRPKRRRRGGCRPKDAARRGFPKRGARPTRGRAPTGAVPRRSPPRPVSARLGSERGESGGAEARRRPRRDPAALQAPVRAALGGPPRRRARTLAAAHRATRVFGRLVGRRAPASSVAAARRGAARLPARQAPPRAPSRGRRPRRPGPRAAATPSAGSRPRTTTDPGPPGYSSRRATWGLTEAALRAGQSAAATAVPRRTTATAARVERGKARQLAREGPTLGSRLYGPPRICRARPSALVSLHR